MVSVAGASQGGGVSPSQSTDADWDNIDLEKAAPGGNGQDSELSSWRVNDVDKEPAVDETQAADAADKEAMQKREVVEKFMFQAMMSQTPKPPNPSMNDDE